MGSVGIGTHLARLPTREIKIIVSSHVCQFRFGHSRTNFSNVEPLCEYWHVAGECVLGQSSVRDWSWLRGMKKD